MGCSMVVGIVGVWLVTMLLSLVGCVWIAVRVWRLRDSVGIAVKLVTSIFVLAVLGGVVGTSLGLASGLRGVAGGGEASDRARLLAEGISTAMNCTALGVLVSVPTLIVLGVLMRGRWRPRAVPHPDE